VRLRVQGGILVHLDDPDVRVVQVLLHPVGLDEHVLGVAGHSSLLVSKPGISVNDDVSPCQPADRSSD
jgi:hypothetical protein